MKTAPVLLAALLAASGAAFAADTSTDTTARTDSASATQSGDTLGAKTRRGAHKVGDAFRQAGRDAAALGHRVAHPHDHGYAQREAGGSYGGANNDYRSRDASGAAARRDRMDQAYANWQARRGS